MTHRDGTEEPGGADEVAAARDALDGRHEPLDGRRDAVDGERDAVDGGRDALGDLSETDVLRLQAAMDRRSKAQEALANIVKKQDEVEDDIADNLK